MAKPVYTFNAFHLGDNLVHLHFLRKAALQNPERSFLHFAQWQYLRQLRDVISDVPNVQLGEFSHMIPTFSIDAWRGAGGFWYSHPNRNDFVQFHLEWFEILARKMDLENPIKNATQMLFDYPMLKATETDDLATEILVINSPPGSNQLVNYDAIALERLSIDLRSKGHFVTSTWPLNPNGEYYFSATDIGRISQRVHTIVMVSTGPSWPTFNIWNQTTVNRRIILLDNERVNLAPNTVHCSRMQEVEEQLKEDGLL